MIYYTLEPGYYNYDLLVAKCIELFKTNYKVEVCHPTPPATLSCFTIVTDKDKAKKIYVKQVDEDPNANNVIERVNKLRVPRKLTQVSSKPPPRSSMMQLKTTSDLYTTQRELAACQL